MKKTEDFHPHYHMIKVVMTDGTTFSTYSTYGSEGDTLTLDVDPKTHPAWTGANQHLVDRGGRELPIEARYVGRLVPTAANEIIEVKFQEIDGLEKVLLVERVD